MLGPELNVQKGRSNVGLGRVEDAWTTCFFIMQVCEKYLANGKDVFCAFMGKMYSVKMHTIRSIGMVWCRC